METVNYYPRICDQVLNRKLQLTGATLVVGPKWCGKTETALQAARSVIYIQSDVSNCLCSSLLSLIASSDSFLKSLRFLSLFAEINK